MDQAKQRSYGISGGNDMRNKIKKCMKDLMQNNCICNYVIVQNENEIYIQNIRALDAYIETLKMSKNGNVKCYMASLGKENKAVSPIFTVINGVIKLGNCIIK